MRLAMRRSSLGSPEDSRTGAATGGGSGGRRGSRRDGVGRVGDGDVESFLHREVLLGLAGGRGRRRGDQVADFDGGGGAEDGLLVLLGQQVRRLGGGGVERLAAKEGEAASAS